MKSIYSNYEIDAEIKNTKEKYYFIFNERNLLIINNTIPLISDLNQLNIKEDNIKNELLMVNGVADVVVYGGNNRTMRINLNPDKLAEYGISASKLRPL